MAQEPWITTASGTKFHFLNPSPDEIQIKDIAFSLANQCRFNGHVPFFSVAEHSVAVAARLPPKLQLAGLLHDATEAYLSDIPTPIKELLPDYQAIETQLDIHIRAKFKISLTDDEEQELKAADKDAVYTEARYLLPDKGQSWVPLLFTPQPRFAPRNMPPPEAYSLFMHWFTDLSNTVVENSIVVVAG